MAKSNKMTREQAVANADARRLMNQLMRGNIGEYARQMGVLPRYLAGGIWHPAKKR